jgi:capsular exopolysaccharide synthesis family protein
MSPWDPQLPDPELNLPVVSQGAAGANPRLPVPAGEAPAPDRSQALAPATLARAPNLPGLLVALQRRWLLALTVGIPCGLAAAAAAWFLIPTAKYTVRAMVHISSVPEAGQGRVTEAVAAVAFQKTQVTLVKSHVILDAVLADPEVESLRLVRQQPSPREWLAQQIEVDFSQGPEILAISLKGDDTAEMKVLVNKVMKTYLDQFLNAEEQRRKARLDQLTEFRAHHEKILSQKRDILASFAPTLGNGDARVVGGIHEFRAQQLGQATQDLHKAQADKARLELTLAAQQSKAKSPTSVLVPPLAVEKEIQADTLVQAYRARIAGQELEAGEIRAKATSPEAAAELLRKRGTLVDLEATQAALDRHLEQLRPKVVERLRQQAVAALEAEAAQTEELLLIAREQEKMLAKVVSDLSAEAKSVGQETLKMSLSAREVEDEEKIVASVADEIRILQMQLLAPPRAKPLDEAVASAAPDSKKKLLAAGGSGVGSLGLVLFGVALWEFRKRKITSVDEVIYGFGVTLVGTLPWMPGVDRRRPNLARTYGDSNRSNESIDSYRTLLFRRWGSRPPRAVMVTSAMPGEGKTALASHLALSIARSGRRTVLVDTDLRRPAAHRMFGQAQGPGLAEYVRGEADLAAVIHPTPVPGLDLLPAGAADLRAVYALCGEKVGQLFDALKGQFDFVVVDACPVLPVADSLHVAAHVDGVLLSFLRRVSVMPKAAAALHRLKLIGVPIFGAVLSGSEEDVYGSECYVSPAGPEQ